MGPYDKVMLFTLYQEVPRGSEELGVVRVGDSGATIGCGWDSQVNVAKSQARKIGGNAIKIVSVIEPSLASTCYTIEAKILKTIEQRYVSEESIKTNHNEKSLKSNWTLKGHDEIEGIYERLIGTSGVKYLLAIRKESAEQYQAIYISGNSGVGSTWEEGYLKAKIMKTAVPHIYKTEWYRADKSIDDNLYISFEPGSMKIIWANSKDEDRYLKLYPISESSTSSFNSNSISSGTGFALHHSGYIVTNYHVVDKSNTILVKGINSNFNISYTAVPVVKDKINDLVILKITDGDFSRFERIPYDFNTKLLDTGDNVFALGYPLRATMGDEIKLTNGIVSSRTGYQGDVSNYQISVPVQPGNSGGPLLDGEGNIVGVISAKHTGAENASYAIKISYLMNLLALIDESSLSFEDKHNVLDDLSLSQQVKKIKDFVYIIECN